MSVKKNKGKPANSLDWHEIWDELSGTNDRAAALIGEAILDQNLTTLLSNYFVENQSEVNKILADRGIFSGLYKKSSLAYCLGLITHGQLEDLRAINNIRNHFAHGLRKVSFNDQSMQKMVDKIRPYERFLTLEFAGSHRELFNIAVSILTYTLSIEAAKVENRQERKPHTTPEELRNQFTEMESR